MSVWRYLTASSVGAAEGLAHDEATMLHYQRQEEASTPATLRLYTYRSHCALVGRYQSLADEVDSEFCQANDVQVGRRPTGGGAIIMGSNQLGVAITARANPQETPRQALKRYAMGVIAGLAEVGVDAAFRSKNDLEVEGRKIAGLGLYLDSRGAVLFHASVLVDLDVPLMLQVLRIPGAKLSDKAIERVEQRVTTVAGQLGQPVAAVDVQRAFSVGIASAFGVELDPGELSAAEQSRLEELRDYRYGSEEWTFQRSPRRDARGSSILKTPSGLLRIYVAVHGTSVKSTLVNGDFNVLPPSVGRLEAALKWCRISRDAVSSAVAGAMIEDDLGVDSDLVAEAIWTAAVEAQRLQEAGHPVRGEGSCYFPESSETTERSQESTGELS